MEITSEEKQFHFNKEEFFSCHECSKQFRDKYSLEVHMTLHTGTKLLKCNEHPQSLHLKHSLGSGKGGSNQMCSCSGILNETEIKTEKILYHCTGCDQEFNCENNYKQHLETHLTNQPVCCNGCLKTFPEHYTLTDHQCSILSDVEKSFQSDTKIKPRENSQEDIQWKELNTIFINESNIVNENPTELYNEIDLDTLAENVTEKCLTDSNKSMNEFTPLHKAENVLIDFVVKEEKESEAANTENIFQVENHSNVQENIFEQNFIQNDKHKSVKCKTCSETFIMKSDIERHDCASVPVLHSEDEAFSKSLAPVTYDIGLIENKKKQLVYENVFHKHSEIQNKETLQFNKEERLQCKRCSETYDKNNFSEHGKMHEKANALLPVLSAKKYIFKCNECPKTFKIKRYLQAHATLHTGIKPFKCSECPEAFRLKRSLETHIIIHTGEKPFKCTMCDMSFSRKYTLKTHVMAVHNGEEPFKCKPCQVSFRTHYSYRCHISNHVESGRGLFKCKLCPRKFSSNDRLSAHLGFHNGEEVFKCIICENSFSSKHSLKLHMMIHAGEKPFSCNECNKSFRLKVVLEHHMKIHTGERAFKCPICFVTFSRKSTLETHVRQVHIGEKPFTCKQCYKTFKRKQHLDVHKNIHTGLKQYCCGLCSSRFSQEGSLKKHLLKNRAQTSYACELCGSTFVSACILKQHSHS